MLFLSIATVRAPGGRWPPRVRHVEITAEWLTLELAGGQETRMPTGWSPALAQASPAQRRAWRLVAGGVGVAWPALGEIVSLHPVVVRERTGEGGRDLEGGRRASRGLHPTLGSITRRDGVRRAFGVRRVTARPPDDE
jgi:hypothetical protein